MTTAEFSESSYAFAMTRELVSGAYGTVVGAPKIPTLRQEGAPGGGYDVEIPYQAVPLFLQFKVPQVLRRTSKLRPPHFPIPYYRIALRTKRPNQHQLLLDLDSPGSCVFYAAPIFHQCQEFDRHYASKQVVEHSAFVAPSDVGPLDDEAHHLAYAKTSPCAWCFSEPTRLERDIAAEVAWSRIRKAVSQAPEQDPGDFLADLGERVISKVNRRLSDRSDGKFVARFPLFDEEGWEPIHEIPDEPFRPLELRDGGLAEIAAISRTYLGSELFIVGVVP